MRRSCGHDVVLDFFRRFRRARSSESALLRRLWIDCGGGNTEAGIQCLQTAARAGRGTHRTQFRFRFADPKKGPGVGTCRMELRADGASRPSQDCDFAVQRNSIEALSCFIARSCSWCRPCRLREDGLAAIATAVPGQATERSRRTACARNPRLEKRRVDINPSCLRAGADPAEIKA